ncbi:MAG: ATP-binding cassette domain-containing protein [Bacilli bacterium]|nr:ATP-binding cassette domain-containing protein [Bacilli bacterium]
MKNIIEIENLYYKNIFQNFSINIEENSYTCISGPNNCGKTTLIRIIDKQIRDNFPITINNEKISNYEEVEYTKLIQTVIPLEVSWEENTLELVLLENCKDDEKLYNDIVKRLKLTKLLSKKTKDLTDKEIIIAQILIGILNKPKILLLDSIDTFFQKEESKNMHVFLKEVMKKLGITIIETTINLDTSLFANRLVIIQNGKIVLDGEPIKVLEKDNVINKIGLRLPFMIDLSVKLRDYNLIKEIELDQDRMVEKLWK